MAGPPERRAGATARVPWLLAAPAVLGLAFLLLPLLGLVVRAPWPDALAILAGERARQALRLSLLTATAATAAALVLGVPLAWLLARGRLRAERLVRALVTVPLVLPPVVGGVALLTVLGRSGLVGRPLYDLTGFAFPFTPYGVVLAQTFVALPYLVLAVEGALRTVDPRFEDAAATLGAGPLTAFRRVTLPLVLPGLTAGAALAWARALGEFGATITFAGSFPGTTRTMPLEVYLTLETDPGAALVLSALLLAVSVAVLAGLGGRLLNAPGAPGGPRGAARTADAAAASGATGAPR